jgi:hypothetical protein
MTGQEIIFGLASEGIRLFLSGDRVTYRYEGEGEPARDKVIPLLDALKRNKTEIMELLKAVKVRPKPFLDSEGDPVIPFNSDPKYHWWNGGQTVSETIRELGG